MQTQTSSVHNLGIGTPSADEVSCDTSSEDLSSIVSESATSKEQSLPQDVSTVSTLEHTPKSDMNISGESSVTSPESDISVSGVDDHIPASSSDIQFKFSVDVLNLPSSWHRKICADSVCFYKLFASTDQPPNVSRAVSVNVDGTWKVYVHNHALSSSCESLKVVSKIITGLDSLIQLIELVDGLRVCAGHPDVNFVSFCLAKKGKFTSQDGEEVAYVDSYLPISLNGESYLQTVRTNECELLVRTPKCAACKKYRKTIRTLYNRWKQRGSDSFSDSSCHTNNRYLNTPEKLKKLKNLRMRSKTAEAKLKRLRENVNKMIAQGHELDHSVHDDMVQVMNENSDKVLNDFPEGSFQRLFWQQQLDNAKKQGPNRYRWHPMIVKWCLNMRLISGASYHAMRTSGFISLPSERTLRDYTNYIKATPGLHFDVLKQMKEQSKVSEMPGAKSYVTILLDEMKVKEDIVYDKLTGGMIGFVNLGSINDQLRQAAEEDTQKTKHPPVADHILAVMVRGLFFKFEFPLAHYPSLGVTGDELLPIVWEVVRFVETTGLKVIAITADGAAPNRRFFRMHGNGNGLTYKVKNIYAADERYIYFISDPPHLVKTIRNCFSHSYGPGSTREMQVRLKCDLVDIRRQYYLCAQVNGQSIKWSHVQELYDKKFTTSVASSGLSLLPKLKREHVHLTSFSRMRVDLAAQVRLYIQYLSSSV